MTTISVNALNLNKQAHPGHLLSYVHFNLNTEE